MNNIYIYIYNTIFLSLPVLSSSVVTSGFSSLTSLLASDVVSSFFSSVPSGLSPSALPSVFVSVLTSSGFVGVLTNLLFNLLPRGP